VDGLVFTALTPLLPALSARTHLLVLVHSPLDREGGLSESTRRQRFLAEKAALPYASRVVATSAFAATELQARFQLPAVASVKPGCDPLPLRVGSQANRLLFAGTITPRKGQHLLLEALSSLRDLPWTLDCAGSLDRNERYVRSIGELIERFSLSARVMLLGELGTEALEQEYHLADLFVHPSLYETYGMVLAEALAAGLPILTTRGGAIPQTVPASAGWLVPPGDVSALQHALRQLLEDGDKLSGLAEGARRVRASLSPWSETIEQMKHQLEQMKGSNHE